MKCKKCGEEIESKLLYCPKCGESIQLVPDYNVLEEELLSRVVEDKKKCKEDKFAEGVYKNSKEKVTATPSPVKTKQPKATPYFSKRFKMGLGLLLVLCIIGFCIFAAYSGKHSYNNVMDMAIAAEESEQYGKALGYYNEAYSLKNDSFEAAYGIGRMNYKVKEYKKAIEYLSIALKEEPTNTNIYTYLLNSYDALNDKAGIAALLEDAPNDEIATLISSYLILPPVFSEEGGEYEGTLSIALSADSETQIFYTTNGKNPITSGKIYSKPIELKEGTIEIKAVALSDDGNYSEIVSKTYIITASVLEMPVVTPAPGTYTDLTYVSISVPDGCTAYYTWDGTNPIDNGAQYTEPFEMLQGSRILAVVIKDSNGNNSPIFIGEYNYQP